MAYVCERRDILIGNEKSFREARHVVTFWALGTVVSEWWSR